MNRDSIINKVFSRAFLGYDAEEVDSFLDEVIREFDRMRQELDVSRLRNKMLIEELDRYRTAAQEKAADEPSDAEETAEKATKEAAEERDETEATPVEEQAGESAEEQSAPTEEPTGESDEEEAAPAKEAAPEGNEESNTTPIEETEQTKQTDATEAADVQ